MQSKQQLGVAGELRARRHLERCGYEFVSANARTRYGEIDLVMLDGPDLVFVEVKTRRGEGTGDPAEAVTSAKLSHTIAAAQAYLADRQSHQSWRIDVVAVNRNDLRHLRNVTAAML